MRPPRAGLITRPAEPTITSPIAMEPSLTATSPIAMELSPTITSPIAMEPSPTITSLTATSPTELARPIRPRPCGPRC